MTDPKKATIADLFRLMTEMRSDMTGMRGDLEAVKATLADQSETLNAHTARFDSVDAKLKQAGDERQAIRDVVDTLPTYDQVVQLEHGLASTQSDTKTIRSDTKAIRSEVRTLTTRINRAGIPV